VLGAAIAVEEVVDATEDADAEDDAAGDARSFPFAPNALRNPDELARLSLALSFPLTGTGGGEGVDIG